MFAEEWLAYSPTTYRDWETFNLSDFLALTSLEMNPTTYSIRAASRPCRTFYQTSLFPIVPRPLRFPSSQSLTTQITRSRPRPGPPHSTNKVFLYLVLVRQRRSDSPRFLDIRAFLNLTPSFALLTLNPQPRSFGECRLNMSRVVFFQ